MFQKLNTIGHYSLPLLTNLCSVNLAWSVVCPSDECRKLMSLSLMIETIHLIPKWSFILRSIETEWPQHLHELNIMSGVKCSGVVFNATWDTGWEIAQTLIFKRGALSLAIITSGEGCLFAIIRNFLLVQKFPQTICIHWLEKIGSKDVTLNISIQK